MNGPPEPVSLRSLLDLLPLSAVGTAAVFALLYPYLNAYYGEVGVRLSDTGENPVDLFWRFALTVAFYSDGGLPLVLPLLAFALRRVHHPRVRYALLMVATIVFLVVVLLLLPPSGPRAMLAILFSVPVAALVLVLHARGISGRSIARRLPLSALALVVVALWGGVAAYGNARGREDAQAYLAAPVSSVPPRTLLERLAGVSSERLVQQVTAATDGPAASLNGALVRRFAVADGQFILIRLDNCDVVQVSVDEVMLREAQPSPGDSAVAGFPQQGCVFTDLLVG